MSLDLERLAQEAREIFRPLADGFRSPKALAALLERLGYAREPDALAALVHDLASFVEQLDALADDEPNPSGDETRDRLGRALRLLAAVVKIAEALPDAANKLSAIGIGASFLDELLALTLIAHLDRSHPAMFHALVFLGVVRATETAASGDRQVDYRAFRIDWQALASAF